MQNNNYFFKSNSKACHNVYIFKTEVRQIMNNVFLSKMESISKLFYVHRLLGTKRNTFEKSMDCILLR